ncbi:acetyltransferase [Granulosicoccus sp. 3-233]|uniref:acetyltransferase n=1 Tax=Granulosicoccus sp. 3-233 TaxID=3417969 RepID=UPI003D3448CD
MGSSVFVFGAGGFAREVAWLIDSSANSPFKVIGFIDDNQPQPADWPDSRPVMSFEEAVSMNSQASFAIGVGSPATRKAIAARLIERGLSSPVLVHSSVAVSSRVRMGSGSIICAGNILTVDIEIGEHVHVNLDCTVGHDVVIGDYTTISPGVHVSGNVTMGEGVFVGTGANILNGSAGNPLVLGDGGVIAAGSCVTKSTEPYTLYAGVPAVAKKKLA